MSVIRLGADDRQAPRPAGIRVTLSASGSLPRTADGRAVFCSPRPSLRSVRLIWEELDEAEAALVLGVMAQGTFFMSYPDPLEGGTRRAEFTCGSREAEIAWSRDGELRVSRLTCSVTEV